MSIEQTAIEKSKQLISELSYEDLLKYCQEQEKKFSELSMVDSFVFRKVSIVVNTISRKQTAAALDQQLKQNELMRKRSLENASNRYIY